MYRMKRSGPRMLPWGMPDETGNILDRTFVIETHCILEVK